MSPDAGAPVAGFADLRDKDIGYLTLKTLREAMKIEAPCSKLQGIYDPQGSTIYSDRSLTPQQATGNALAPGFMRMQLPDNASSGF